MSSSPAPNRRRRSPTRALAAALALVTLGAALVAIEPASPAEAASYGYGYNGGNPGVGAGAGWMGSVIMPDGTQGFCIDPVGLFPSGTTTRQGLVSFIQGTTSATWPNHNDTRTMSGAEIQMLNYALTKYTPLIDTNNEGAALAAYVYAFAVAGRLASYGIDSWVDYVNVRVPASQRATVIAMTNAIGADTAANYATGGSGTANVDINMTDSYNGTVVSAITPTNLSGTLTLYGARFADTGLTTRTVSSGSVIPIVGIPLDSDVDDYNISATLSVTVPGPVSSTVTLWTTSSPAYAQRDISIGAPGPPTVITAFADADDPDIVFEPVLSTQVQSRFVNIGDPYVDTVTAGVAPGSPAWRQFLDGTYVPIVARGTLYGPFEDAPVETTAVPVGAPILGTDTITLTGPGTYTSNSSIIATETGFTTWVWEIRADDQPLIFGDRITPDYYFSDLFGRASETHVVAFSIGATTEANSPEVAVSEGLWDTLEVTAPTDPWLTIGGEMVPVTLTGTAYWEEGDVVPTIAAVPPATATVLGNRTIVATGPGSYSTIADPITAPVGTGYVVWQWSIVEASQPLEYQGYFEDWTDAYGLPAETSRVAMPSVSTEALPEVALTDDAHDVAIVDGMVPAGAYVTFLAYRQPEAGEPINDVTATPPADGDPVEVWDEADLVEPVCVPQNLAFDSSGEPTNLQAGLNETQRYTSPSFEPEETGTFHWRHQLHLADGAIIAESECGAVGETTVVTLPVVWTTATEMAVTGGMARDHAHVDGLVPEGATLVFEAYLHEGPIIEGERGQLICDTSDNPVAVTPGMNEETMYESPECRMPASVGEVFWVETLLSDSGAVLHEGEYGLAAETTRVVPPLPHMGLVMNPVTAFGSGGVIVVFGIVVLIWAHRRRRLATEE